MISIIVPVRFRPDLFQVCLDSLVKYTHEDYELIVIQEGEEPGVKEVLEEYPAAKFVHHSEPKGYPAAINAGYRRVADNAKHVVFLNSDIVCIPNWLTAMLDGFVQDPKVGLVAPMLSEAEAGIQHVDHRRDKIDYRLVDEVKGVCMMLRRDVADDLISRNEEFDVQGGGVLDERFGMGGGDDNDLCLRVRLAGYKILVAQRSFLYHYSSAAFRELFDHDVPYSKKYSASVFQKFRDKWRDKLGHKPRVYIAIPTFGGFVHHELSIRLIEWSHDPEMIVKIQFYPHLVPLDNARNRAVKDFLEDYFDYLLFIDDDIVPPPNCLRELLAADKDIIAPLCFTTKQDDDGLAFPMPVAHRYDENKQYRPYYGKGIEWTNVVTGGCFLAKREVYERMERPFAFTYHKNGLVELSEDFYFSQQAEELGYKLYTHYGLLCKHWRVGDVKAINDLMVRHGR